MVEVKETEKVELLSCPFCGSVDLTIQHTTQETGGGVIADPYTAFVDCAKCETSGPEAYPEKFGPDSFNPIGIDAGAIRLWNTRDTDEDRLCVMRIAKVEFPKEVKEAVSAFESREDNDRLSFEERKAPAGKFRVIGVDTFDGTDWVCGDYPTNEEAVAFADEKGRGAKMLKLHVFDDQGTHMHEAGSF